MNSDNLAQAPKRSIATSELHIGSLNIPIKIYKGYEPIGLSGNTFHDGCNGKVRHRTYCEDCLLEDPPTFSGVKVFDSIFRLSSEDRKNLLLGNLPIEIVNVLPRRAYETSLGYDFIPIGIYQVSPIEHFEKIYTTFLYRLKVSKNVLLIKFVDGSMQRFGILDPVTSRLMPIFYDEEVRQNKFTPDFSSRPQSLDFDTFIFNLSSRNYLGLSAKNILSRIEAWFEKNISNSRKKVGV